MLARQPAHGPFTLALDRGNGFKRFEQVILLWLVLDVGVNKERIGFCVNVFHHNLEPIEGTGFWPADFIGEVDAQVLIDNAIACGKEGKDVLEEVLFISVEVLPVFEIFSLIDFFCGPEASHLLFVHLPDI